MQQTSPIKPQQQQPIILQPTTSTLQTTPSMVPTDQLKSTTSTLFVTPRIVNFQTVVPKPTTNIQIGNTKIILVPSPSTNLPTSVSSPQQQQQTQCLVNNSPVKLVKLTSTLPKNVQIVIPSRTVNESLPTTIHSIPTLTTCSIDQIPQAAQEVTITTSPDLNKLRRRSSSTTTTDKPVGKILRPIAKVLPVYSPTNSNNGLFNLNLYLIYLRSFFHFSLVASPSSTITTSPRHDELTKPMAINFQQRPSTATSHGPMIYRMTSVNSSMYIAKEKKRSILKQTFLLLLFFRCTCLSCTCNNSADEFNNQYRSQTNISCNGCKYVLRSETNT